MDVLTAARERIKNVFNTAPKIYLSFSGGKDSIVLSDIIYKMCLAMQIDRRKLVVDIKQQAYQFLKELENELSKM